MAKTIMVQGTMSNVGKSLLVTGLGRLFHQDGYRVAPFKSQNMALNSFITSDGLEMGRAQVVQAEACGIEPSVLMNPILLKPVSDKGSQVIVNGKVIGNMTAIEYFAMKHRLVPDIIRAFDTLCEMNDIIVIEGAGSPAEINLKEGDIVNMGMARMARAPVLLVGDIDPGGVFAQIAGTLMLLDETERDIVKATIINKFRGDRDILDPGLSMLEGITGKSVAGVLPYLDVRLDDEDSLNMRFGKESEARGNETGGSEVCIDVAVIRLPRLSNFTDFSALDATDGVSVRYIESPKELGVPDMIIIPGTKNTISDLKWLRQSGLETVVKRLSFKGTIVFGICGGYQMLGERISDAVDSEGGGTIAGLGLLPVTTEFTTQKHRTRVAGSVQVLPSVLRQLGGATVEGYEIRMGRTSLAEHAQPLVRLEDGRFDGCFSGNVFGSYLHGFFDSEECRSSLLQALCEKKGFGEDALPAFDYRTYKEEQYDTLADAVRYNLDMELIYRILEEGLYED